MVQEIRFVTSPDNVRLGCGSYGVGPVLVKAPNWLSHLTADWESSVWGHWWQELTNSHRLIRFDQRGCGLSDRTVVDLGFEKWVSDLEVVVEQMQVERFPLFGMSQGAAVAIEYAARHPEKVSCLILYGGIARGWARSGKPIETSQALATLIRDGWEVDNPAFRQVFTSQFMPDATKEQMDSFNELSRMSTSAGNAVRFQEEVGQIDIVSSLAEVACPTIVFHCRADARVPFEQGEQIASLIPGAIFVPLESRNHILLENEPAWRIFVSEFRRFTRTWGHQYQPYSVTGTPISAKTNLTNREVDVLRLIALGKSDRQIAEDLTLSAKTVGNHVRNILAKTDSVNRTAAAIHAARIGLL
jgi:pimeloyl-ACP methyl ester carboxylesterase/DNA-binding CsgD family transcriptional regulator